MTFQDMIARAKEAQAEKERKRKEALEKFKASPEYQRLRELLKAKEGNT